MAKVWNGEDHVRCTGILNQQSHPNPDKACPPLRLFLPDDQLQTKLKPAVWRSNGKAGNLKIEISKPKLPTNSDAKQADRSLSSLAHYCDFTAQSAAGETLTSGFACFKRQWMLIAMEGYRTSLPHRHGV